MFTRLFGRFIKGASIVLAVGGLLVIIATFAFGLNYFWAVLGVALILLSLLRITAVDEDMQVIMKRPWGQMVTLDRGLNWHTALDEKMDERRTSLQIWSTTIPAMTSDGAKVAVEAKMLWRFTNLAQARKRLGDDPSAALVLYAEQAVRAQMAEKTAQDVYKSWAEIEQAAVADLRGQGFVTDDDEGDWGCIIENVPVDNIIFSRELVEAFDSRVEQTLIRESQTIRHEGFLDRILKSGNSLDGLLEGSEISTDQRMRLLRELVQAGALLEATEMGASVAVGMVQGGDSAAGLTPTMLQANQQLPASSASFGAPTTDSVATDEAGGEPEEG